MYFKLNALLAIHLFYIVMFSGIAAAEGIVSKPYQADQGSLPIISHADMIRSEKDFLREMIEHHQEAVDTSVLIFVSTEDPELRKLVESIYTTRSNEILEMRISYANWYNLIPRGAMYRPIMSDLNAVSGKERDIHYLLHMIVHHRAAVDMAEKVLSLHGIHIETLKFAKHLIKRQLDEISLMEQWLEKAGALM